MAFLIAFLAACGGGKRAQHVGARPCLDVRTFGAVPDDGADDRAALQAAIDAASREHKDVCLPPGDLHVARRPGAITSVVVSKDGVGIRGVGAKSRIVMLGAPEPQERDWWVIEVRGNHHELRDFAMDGTNRGIVGEQTHMIQVAGPASDIVLRNLTLTMPVQEGNRGGDCIRLLGATANERVHDVLITKVHGKDCARSFIGFQRFISKVLVEDVTAVGGSSIDMEPTGDGAIRDVTIRNARFTRGQTKRGGWTVALSGSQTVPSRDIVLEKSQIEGGVWLYKVHGARIRDNTIRGGLPDRAMIKVVKDSQDIVIEGNTILREGPPGDGIEVNGHNGAWASRIVVRKNHIRHGADGFPIHAEPVDGIDITDNQIECLSNTSSHAAVFLRGVLVPIRNARIRRNHIRGNCSEAVRISQHGTLVTGSTIVEDNVVEGVRRGVLFENGAPNVRPVIHRNVFRGVAPAQRVIGSDRTGTDLPERPLKRRE